jgi:hypothetical protein
MKEAVREDKPSLTMAERDELCTPSDYMKNINGIVDAEVDRRLGQITFKAGQQMKEARKKQAEAEKSLKDQSVGVEAQRKELREAKDTIASLRRDVNAGNILADGLKRQVEELQDKLEPNKMFKSSSGQTDARK